MWQPSWVFPSILSAGYAQKNRRLPFFFAFKQKNFASHGVSLRSENINQTTEKKQMSHISSSAFSDTKAHYDLLDGLRGVAALMVYGIIYSKAMLLPVVALSKPSTTAI